MRVLVRPVAAAMVTALGATLTLATAAGGAPVQKDPGRWKLVGTTSLRILYYQGMTHDDEGNFYFDGVDNGLFKTDSSLTQIAGTTPYIPAEVANATSTTTLGPSPTRKTLEYSFLWSATTARTAQTPVPSAWQIPPHWRGSTR